MKNIANYLLLTAMASLVLSCTKDLQDDLKEGGWNHERTILDIKFQNQMGLPVIETIDAHTGDIKVTINVEVIPDMSQVKLEKLQLSYQATASVKAGETLNFDNEEKTAILTVTSATGKQREYTIQASPFVETLAGTYDVKSYVLYGGTGPEYNGGGVYELQDKSWVWGGNAPGTEHDNVLSFTVTGNTDEGNTYGTCFNDPGEDMKYADFLFLAKYNKEGEMDIDLNHFYRQIPVGESTWLRDYTTNTITFTDKEGRETVGTLCDSGTELLAKKQNGVDYYQYTIENQAFAFNLTGVNDWTNIYSDYDKIVKNPRRLWINVVKR